MPNRWNTLAGIGRAAILLLLAGLLIGRRDFAHLNLGDLLPGRPNHLYITETVLLALFPLALVTAFVRIKSAGGLRRAFGWPFVFAMTLCLMGAIHMAAGFARGANSYIIVRQSALAEYAVIFLYAQIFFADDEHHLRLAAWASVGAALVCALLDTFGLLAPKHPELNDGMPIFGQQTLPIAILGLGFCFVAARTWTLRACALAGMVFAAWRQFARPTQSVVLIGMAGALIFSLLLAGIVALRGQRQSLKRAAFCFSLFSALGICAIGIKLHSRGEQPGTETAGEMGSWKLDGYRKLFDVYDKAQMPADLAQRYTSGRPPFARVDDPEAYKLNAVFLAAPSVSVRNNVWRLLVWRRMFGDWREGNWISGSGVGKPWFYRALYDTGFHFGDEREGLDPHNSYLNMLYRYGLIGFALLSALVVLVWRNAFKALSARGDPQVEALCLYAAYTIIFACFTVSLEGPAYAFPFWFALGMVDARARIIRGGSVSSDRSD